ncbi:nicotinate-nucleotide--dimethylbenzimidazole phosphoribosyltransferase [uncultured Ruminococcus sp.]|uniref:nicotinate-nucleotide--dimethylbenzimidazole phosphoribosyltransferase n=1 Tax=uncultured Ruminococcus sp. TaxID=165186 RepID=UPI0026721104|nr:nicotinate-nucleotide--dimethylbenzimidazole phosphoribosyltransferase [uncultured Ruminococcus sp.]
MLTKLLETIRPLDENAMESARLHWDAIAKPLHSLGRLEDMIVQLAGICENPVPAPRKKAVLIFCADNGIVAEGVTQTTQDVTAAVTQNFAKGIASVNALSRICGAEVFPVDIGVAQALDCPGVLNRKVAFGTQNFAHGPAMCRDEAEQAVCTGIDLVQEKAAEGYNLIVTGEMGIGNTTTSSAVFSVLQGLPPEQVTGRGAGLSDAGLQHKIQVISRAVAALQPDPGDVLDVLSKVGGFDVCGMMGAFLGGAICRVPVLVDGFISAVAANCAVRLCPACRDYIFASHCSKEPAGKMALDALHLRAYLDCEMCLGEGTGGVIAAKLFDFALAAYDEIAGFDAVGIDPYQPL